MEWESFIGRFHPLLVHLPIGIFLLGYFLEILFQFGFRKLIGSRHTITFIYGIGLFAGVFAAVSGLLLSYSDDYAIDALEDHKLLGIATLVVMVLVIIYQIKAPEIKGKSKLAASTIAIVLTGLTGHFGGNLTHGSTYLLEYATNPSDRYEAVNLKRLHALPSDSIQIYADILYPVIEKNCIACHNSENYKGGLVLETYSDLFKEADYAVPLVAGNPYSSEIFSRVNLPAHHEKSMPPRGSGLNYTDIEILKYWIESGADSLATFNSETMSDELILLINRDYGLDYSPRPHYEKVKVDSIANELIAELTRSKFRVKYLSSTNFLLDIEFKGDSISKEQIESLNQVADHITFLNLSDSSLSEDLMPTLAEMSHLTRVNFSKNKLNSDMISFLIKHKYLESTNLNTTDLTSESLKTLLDQSNLKRVYILDTKVTEDELANLKGSYADTEVISGFKFQPVAEAKSVFAQDKGDR
jgi:uncharacterized membrane protein